MHAISFPDFSCWDAIDHYKNAKGKDLKKQHKENKKIVLLLIICTYTILWSGKAMIYLGFSPSDEIFEKQEVIIDILVQICGI